MPRTKVSFWDSIKTRFPRWGASKRGFRISADYSGNLSSVLVPDYGVDVNNESALRVTALYAGIRLLSENIASLPKDVRKKTKEVAGTAKKAVHEGGSSWFSLDSLINEICQGQTVKLIQ